MQFVVHSSPTHFSHMPRIWTAATAKTNFWFRGHRWENPGKGATSCSCRNWGSYSYNHFKEL